jgi:phosphohistidine phosphatase
MAQDTCHTLVLFRHAKSAWPDMADHDRPLARRGIKAAPIMGRWLRDAGLVPDQVLCSTARRARETWQLAQPGLAATPPVTFDRGIYEGTAADLLDLIRQVPAETGTLLLVGHNPAIEDLALTLTAAVPGAGPAPGTAGSADLGRMREKFPTGAIAVLRAAGSWPGLAPGQARLTAFAVPRDLTAPPTQDPAIP